MEGTGSYLVRRLLWVPVILFVVSFFTFALGRLGPGDPIRIAQGQYRNPDALARVRHARGLDKPLYAQYWIYMKGVLTRGDLGESYKYPGRDVSELIFPALWRTLQFNSIALIITLAVGIPLGVFAARMQGGWLDPASIGSFLLFQSIPSIVVVPFLILFMALRVHLVPANGWPHDCGANVHFLGAGYQCIGVFNDYTNIHIPGPWRLHIPVVLLSKEAVIPILALSVPSIAGWARFTRAFTLDVLKEDYVRTARSKGLSEFTILSRHVLRNALLPLSTLIAFALVGLLEGSFFIENLSGIPGVGQLALNSVNGRDYDMIMAITMLGATSFVIASIGIDVMYTFIDPRIRYSARSS